MRSLPDTLMVLTVMPVSSRPVLTLLALPLLLMKSISSAVSGLPRSNSMPA